MRFKLKVTYFATHPIQYQVPVYRELAKKVDLTVVYMMKENADLQASSGFRVRFHWDIPMYDQYNHEYIGNHSEKPSSSRRRGIILENDELLSLLKKLQPDIVIVNGWFPLGNFQVINLCYKIRIPVICRGDSHLKMKGSKLRNIAKKIYLTSVLRKISHFIEVGQLNGQFYDFMGIALTRRSKAFHCIDTEFFSLQARNCIKADREKINLGFSGKFIEKKNPLEFLRAVFLSKYKSRIRLILVGDGPLREMMHDYCKENEIEAEFKGFLNQSEIVPKGYCLMDALVISSSHNETWGLVANEAMTCGIPVIVSDVVGCGPDLVEEGKTGFIYSSGRPEELGSRIDSFIEASDKGIDFKTAVLKKIENYSLENTINGYLAAINKLAC